MTVMVCHMMLKFVMRLCGSSWVKVLHIVKETARITHEGVGYMAFSRKRRSFTHDAEYSFRRFDPRGTDSCRSRETLASNGFDIKPIQIAAAAGRAKIPCPWTSPRLGAG